MKNVAKTTTQHHETNKPKQSGIIEKARGTTKNTKVDTVETRRKQKKTKNQFDTFSNPITQLTTQKSSTRKVI